MKKAILVLVLILAALASLSAASNQIGIVTGPSLQYGRGDYYATPSFNYSQIDYGIGIRGTNYFTKFIGIGYGADVFLPISFKMDDVGITYPQTKVSFDVSLSLQFKVDISSAFAIEAGAGIYYLFENCKTGSSLKYHRQYYNLFADADIAYSITGRIQLKAGARAAFPIYSKHTLVDAVEETNTVKGIFILPYIGVSFAY